MVSFHLPAMARAGVHLQAPPFRTEKLTQLLNEGLSEVGIEYDQDVIHAGAAETAMVLAIDENLVRTEKIEPGPEGEISPARLLSEGFKSITENGVLGDPNEATAEAGETIIQRVVEAYVEHIKTERSVV